MQNLSGAEFGWFTPPDLERLYSAISRLPNPSNVVLVGGQSLSFWVDFFRIPVPRFDTGYLTQDADFVGSKRDAEMLARELGAEIRIAQLQDNQPNLAVLTYDGTDGKRLLIDFLSVIVGLDDREIKTRAIPIEWDDKHLFILHPMLCLQSRIENLYHLPGKRNGNGISQARIAVEVAKHYISQVLDELSERDALDATKQIRGMGFSRAGLYVYKHYGIDVLDAVEPDRFTSEEFKAKHWPQVIKWIAKRRVKNARGSLRLQANALRS